MPAADERTIAVPRSVLVQVAHALQGAHRLSATHDAMEAAMMALDAPKPGRLTELLTRATDALARTVGDAPASERTDQHLFPLDHLNEPFLTQLMRDRGWSAGQIVVGSAQGETMARHLLHSASPASRLREQVKVSPMSAGHKVERMDAWALIEASPAPPLT